MEPKVKQIANLAKFIQKKSSKRENPNQYRLYDITGISPTIGCMQGGGRQPLILLKMKNEVKINIVGKRSSSSASNGNVYATEGIYPTLVNHVGCEPRIVVSKPINTDGEGNARTLRAGYHKAEKANLKERKDGYAQTGVATICLNSKVDGKQPSSTHRVYSDEGLGTAVTTSFMPSYFTDFRIRKLTERECFRLMGVREDDIDKLLKAGICKTHLYQLAGNSIVCDVMSGIFTNLFLTEDKNDELADLW